MLRLCDKCLRHFDRTFIKLDCIATNALEGGNRRNEIVARSCDSQYFTCLAIETGPENLQALAESADHALALAAHGLQHRGRRTTRSANRAGCPCAGDGAQRD
jgi:hypothetical protein